MPKKKTIINGFSLFMKDVQRDLAKKEGGRHVPLAEISVIAHPMWNELQEFERNQYNTKAKQIKQHKADTMEGKFTSNGIPVAFLERQEEERIKAVKQMAADIRSLVSNLTHEELIEKPFYIISFNILICTSDEEYLPNEIGLIEYTIKDGITNSYHRFIDPGPVPIGYMSATKHHSETTHQIPYMDFDLFDQNYEEIFERILEFTNAHRSNVMIFSHSDQLEQNSSSFEWLRKKAGYPNPKTFFITDLTMLLEQLRGGSGFAYEAKICAIDALKSNSFDYVSNTRCEYHEDLDNPYCALGFSRRLCFILSDELAHLFQIELTPRHMPERTVEFQSLEWRPAGPIRPVVNIIDVPEKPVKPHISTTLMHGIESRVFVDNDRHTSIVPSLTQSSAENRPQVPNLSSKNDFPGLSAQSSQTSSLGSASRSTVAERLQAQLNQRPGERKPSRQFTIGRGHPLLKK